jgi:hypothetical protein
LPIFVIPEGNLLLLLPLLQARGGDLPTSMKLSYASALGASQNSLS